jgi:hypothetical protein
MPLPTDYAERKLWQMWTFLIEYFPDAFEEVVRVAIAGNQQHNPGEPLHWARGKSADQMNTAFRHMWDHKRVGPLDTDGCFHLAKAIWRLSAELQLTLEAEATQNMFLNTIGDSSGWDLYGDPDSSKAGNDAKK